MRQRVTTSFLLLFLLLCAAALPTHVLAQNTFGAETTAKQAGLPLQTDVGQIIGNIVGNGLSLVSVLFFILMIYGGIRWMLARGKEDEVRKSLDTIIAAIVGIIVVLSAYAITTFVLKSTAKPEPGTIPVSGGLPGGGAPGAGGKGTCSVSLSASILTGICNQFSFAPAPAGQSNFDNVAVCEGVKSHGVALCEYDANATGGTWCKVRDAAYNENNQPTTIDAITKAVNGQCQIIIDNQAGCEAAVTCSAGADNPKYAGACQSLSQSLCTFTPAP